MEDSRIGRTVLVLRQLRAWRQSDLAARSGVSASAISDIERGRVEIYTLATLRAVLAAFDARASLGVTWGGRGDLDRLLDADHAGIVQSWAGLHLRSGWELWNEASYSIYGERGRIDQLAFHRATGVLEVSECKTGIWDVQDTLGRLDTKIRLARRVAASRGWQAGRVVGALVIADGRTVRRRVAEHDVLFARYATRGRAAHAWVRDPRPATGGLLVFIPLPRANQGGLRRAGQRRVRLPSAQLSVDRAAEGKSRASGVA